MSSIKEQLIDATLRVEDEIETLMRQIGHMESGLLGLQLQYEASKAVCSPQMGPRAVAGTYLLQRELDWAREVLGMRREEMGKLVGMFEDVVIGIAGMDFESLDTSSRADRGIGRGRESEREVTGAYHGTPTKAQREPVALWSAEPSVFSPTFNSAKAWGPVI